MSFVVWEWVAAPGCCSLTNIQNVDRAYELGRGVARSDDFPDDAEFNMDPQHPRSVKLPDQATNLEDLLVVSGRVKGFVETLDLEDVEFLPVRIINHKGRLASDDYWIVNPLTVVDCIDTDASDIEWNKIEPDRISFCDELVLRDDEIPEELRIFRPKHLEDVVLVHEEVGEALAAEGFPGLDIVELDEFVR